VDFESVALVFLQFGHCVGSSYSRCLSVDLRELIGIIVPTCYVLRSVGLFDYIICLAFVHVDIPQIDNEEGR